MLRVTWMYVKSCSHNSLHELNFTSVIFDMCTLPVRHAWPLYCGLRMHAIVKLSKKTKALINALNLCSVYYYAM